MSSGGFLALLLTAVLLPLTLNECRDWCPWLAKQLVRWTAHQLGDPEARSRYEEEWVANIDAVPGKLSPLMSALGYLIALPKMRWTLRRSPRVNGTRSEQLPSDILAQLPELHASRQRIAEAGFEQTMRLLSELHDGAQPPLVAVAMQLDLIERRLGDSDPEAARLIGSARHDLQSAIQEIRTLIKGHSPYRLTEGLEIAVKTLVARIPILVTVEHITPHRLPSIVEATAYFVVSEALSNVMKHSRATTASVRLDLVHDPAGDRLRIEVVDNGVGGADPNHGTGLRGLAARAAVVDGTLSITDVPSGGTRLVIELRCDSIVPNR